MLMLCELKQRIPCIICIAYLQASFGKNKCALYTGKYGIQLLALCQVNSFQEIEVEGITIFS